MNNIEVKKLKKVIPIWPETKVATSGMSVDTPTSKTVNIVRTIITLVRVKHDVYRLYEVRNDYMSPLNDTYELGWVENLKRFHKNVRDTIQFSDPKHGVIDNNQEPINYLPF